MDKKIFLVEMLESTPAIKDITLLTKIRKIETEKPGSLGLIIKPKTFLFATDDYCEEANIPIVETFLKTMEQLKDFYKRLPFDVYIQTTESLHPIILNNKPGEMVEGVSFTYFPRRHSYHKPLGKPPGHGGQNYGLRVQNR